MTTEDPGAGTDPIVTDRSAEDRCMTFRDENYKTFFAATSSAVNYSNTLMLEFWCTVTTNLVPNHQGPM